jgi:hypothetical protein
MKGGALEAIKGIKVTSTRQIQFFSTTNDIYISFKKGLPFLSCYIELIIRESPNSKERIFCK